MIIFNDDFIDGALGTKEAVGIVDKVKYKIFEYKCNLELNNSFIGV